MWLSRSNKDSAESDIEEDASSVHTATAAAAAAATDDAAADEAVDSSSGSSSGSEDDEDPRTQQKEGRSSSNRNDSSRDAVALDVVVSKHKARTLPKQKPRSAETKHGGKLPKKKDCATHVIVNNKTGFMGGLLQDSMGQMQLFIGTALTLLLVSMLNNLDQALMELWFPTNLEHRILWYLCAITVLFATFIIFHSTMLQSRRRWKLESQLA
jgi:hypothetical protein